MSKFGPLDEAELTIKTMAGVYKATFGYAWGMNDQSNQQKPDDDTANPFLAPLEIGMHEVIKKALEP